MPNGKTKKRARNARRIAYETGRVRFRVIFLPVLALLLTLVVELFNRSLSLPALVSFIAARPLYFLYNALIVLTSLVFSELFRRRKAVLTTTSIVWLVLGVVQYIVIKDRTQPFCSVDILMLKDAFSLITIYYTWPQIILMFGSGFAVICLVMTFVTGYRKK